MADIEINSEIRAPLENIKAWLSSRQSPPQNDLVVIPAPDGLRSMGFADLCLQKAGPEHQETVTSSYDEITQKAKSWTEVNNLITWSNKFLEALKRDRSNLATLELIRGAKEFPISLAKYHVEESICVVNSALSFDFAIEIQHPDTRGHFYAVYNMLIDDSTNLHDIIRQIFACLYSKCLVRLVVKTNQFYSAALAALVVDMMHKSGASDQEVSCIGFERRESIGNERFFKCISPAKSSKLSTIATVFKQTDTFAAAQGIIESYFREQYPNLIVLVEESAFERFIRDWQRYYSHCIHIGARLDNRTTVVDHINSKVQIDLEAIDIKASHKMIGHAINILKFRTLSELLSLLGNLRKVPFMSVWNDDILLSREFCLRVNSCNDFWLNHAPKSLAAPKFSEDTLNFYAETVAEDMTSIYNSVYAQYPEEVDQLRKLHASFMKKDGRLKTMLILQAYISMVSKSRSLKNGSSTTGAVARFKRFQQGIVQKLDVLEPGNSQVEQILKPVGLAIILVREETSIKSKTLLVEFIFKNLILGNAVLLACPPNTLGAKFSLDNDHVIPFKMVHESLPDISRLSLDSSFDVSEASVCKKQCPKNTYAIEMLPEMTTEILEGIIISLGSRRKSIWFPDPERANYWSSE